MKINAYTIFDNKGVVYHTPFFATTDAAAIRSVSDIVNDLNTTIGRHPSDYVLYCCGTYDDFNGLLQAEQPPRHVLDAVALLKVQPELLKKG